jgi:hypothetical protein
MGDKNSKKKKNNDMENYKKRINEASLNIFIIGKYNRLMDILIGNRKDNVNEINEENFLVLDSENGSEKNANILISNNKSEEKNQILILEDIKEQKIDTIDNCFSHSLTFITKNLIHI